MITFLVKANVWETFCKLEVLGECEALFLSGEDFREGVILKAGIGEEELFISGSGWGTGEPFKSAWARAWGTTEEETFVQKKSICCGSCDVKPSPHTIYPSIYSKRNIFT